MATYNLHRMGLLLLVFTKLSIIDGATVDCTPTNRPHIKCTLEKSSSIACDESGLAYQYVDVGWPSKPLNYEIVTTSTLYTDGKHYGGVNVSWQAPQDGSLKYLKGFLLRFVGVERQISPICRFFNLTEANWTNEDILNPEPLRFDISLKYMYSNSYFVELTGVPRSPPSLEMTSVHKTITLSSSSVHSKENTAVWSTNMVYDIDNEKHKIHVTFQLAPSEYGFKYYDVFLIPEGSMIAHEKKDDVEVDIGASRHVVTFDDVCEGAYYIDLAPKKTGENNMCVCWRYGVTNCEPCIRTRTIVFNVTGSCHETTTPTHSPTIPPKIPSTLVSKETPNNAVTIPKTGASRPKTTDTPIDGPALAGIIIGITTAVLLLLVMGYLLYSRRWKGSCAVNGPPPESKKPIVTVMPFTLDDNKKDRHPKNGPKNNQDKPQGCEEITEKRRILIIYHPDHERHEAVVMKFANYLYKLCGCEVYLDKWCQTDIQRGTISEWLHDHIKWAEKIIIINSEGAYKKWHAAKEGNIFEKRVGKNPGGDIFLPAIRMLHQELGEGKVDYSRYISAHFEYTAAEFDLPTLSVGSSNYNLMKHIESLFFHIHRINKDEPGVEQEAVEINEEYFNYSPEGFDLHNSILEAGRFQRDHPNWFDQIYELQERKDSGLESMPSGYTTSDDYECFNNNRPKVIIPSDFNLPTDLPNGIYVPTPTPEEGSKSLPYVFIHPPDLHEDVTSLDGKPASAIMREVNTVAPFFGNDIESIDCRTIYKENIDFGQDDDDVRSVASLEV